MTQLFCLYDFGVFGFLFFNIYSTSFTKDAPSVHKCRYVTLLMFGQILVLLKPSTLWSCRHRSLLSIATSKWVKTPFVIYQQHLAMTDSQKSAQQSDSWTNRQFLNGELLLESMQRSLSQINHF